jgi:hypothetical protein
MYVYVSLRELCTTWCKVRAVNPGAATLVLSSVLLRQVSGVFDV